MAAANVKSVMGGLPQLYHSLMWIYAANVVWVLWLTINKSIEFSLFGLACEIKCFSQVTNKPSVIHPLDP